VGMERRFQNRSGMHARRRRQMLLLNQMLRGEVGESAPTSDRTTFSARLLGATEIRESLGTGPGADRTSL
jgi:hypothetical protein